jgi:hypothetical protein
VYVYDIPTHKIHTYILTDICTCITEEIRAAPTVPVPVPNPEEKCDSEPYDPTPSSKMMQLQGLRTCLERADDWDFNVFELETEADGLPLQVAVCSCICMSVSRLLFILS